MDMRVWQTKFERLKKQIENRPYDTVANDQIDDELYGMLSQVIQRHGLHS
jgi:hypothetical protein